MGQQVGSSGLSNSIAEGLARPLIQSAPPMFAQDPPVAVDSLLKIQKQEYEDGTKYTQLVLGLGYAAFFTIWSGTRDQLTKIQVVSSAGLMTISLVAYVVFEVQQMILRTTRLRRLTDAISANPAAIGSALQQFNTWQISSNKKAIRFWSVILYPTIVPAVMAVTILLYGFAVRLHHLLAS
jgi:hypothetical protein